MQNVEKEDGLEMRVTGALIARPEIYKFTLDEVFMIGSNAREAMRIERWGWVDAYSLVTCIDSILESIKIDKSFLIRRDSRRSNLTVLSRFGALNGDDNQGSPLYTYMDSVAADQRSLVGKWKVKMHDTAEPTDFGGRRFVPAGFANAAIDLVEKGIVRVGTEQFDIFGKLQYLTVGYFADGRKVALHRRNNNSFDWQIQPNWI